MVIFAVLIVIFALVLVYFTFFYFSKCSDESCFKSSLSICKKAVFLSEAEDASWFYQINGKSNGECEVEVKILQLKKGSLDIEKLQKFTLFRKIELANAKEVRKATGCNIGSVPPFGNLFNIKAYFDKSVVENEIVAFNAGSHTKSIKMKAKDLVKVVNPVVGEFSK